MIDARINILDGRMTEVDRKSKNITFEDNNKQYYKLSYDVLVLTMELEDKTLLDFTDINGERYKPYCKILIKFS